MISLSCDKLLRINRKAFFNQVADKWDKKFCTPELKDFLISFVPKFNIVRGQRILDVGTGTGVLIPYLARAVGSTGKIIAVDFAEKMVEICNEKFSNFSNVKIELQDVEELNFSPEWFDAITCFGLFPHIENKEKALGEMNRVLKQGGKLIIAHALSSDQIRKHHQNYPIAISNDILPEEDEMRQMLSQAGFSTTYINDELGCYLCITTRPSV
jgi:demethylmenaquinone methyltransferase/2-methoxy-6-polyprenyl-1,4-benzoquinol methylase